MRNRRREARRREGTGKLTRVVVSGDERGRRRLDLDLRERECVYALTEASKRLVPFELLKK